MFLFFDLLDDSDLLYFLSGKMRNLLFNQFINSNQKSLQL